MSDDPDAYSTADMLADIRKGDHEAQEQLLLRVYGELRAIAGSILRKQDASHTLQPTALVHEAYLRLVGHQNVDWDGRTHLLAVASKAMRQILVDHHRRRSAAKRGGDVRHVTLSGVELGESDRGIDFMALQEALGRLRLLDARQSRIVELRFFGGMKMEEIAHVIGVSLTTIEGDWRHARAWLRRELGRD